MRKVFIDKNLLENETLLYGINMPGFMAMCLIGGRSEEIKFSTPEEISEEDLKNFDNIYIVEEGNPILKKMITVNKEEWDFVIGITVDKKTNTATDIIEAIEKISNRM